MADVFGTIGNEQVELHNAATEATLRLLLQATLSANRQSLATIQQLASASGINPASAQAAATQAATTSTRQFSGLLDLSNLNLKQFLDGTATATTTLGTFSEYFSRQGGLIFGTLGLLTKGLQLVAQYQEENLKTYQQISSIGANFGGSLTDMRIAATNTYMTLEEFGSVVSKNGEALVRMGGSTDAGVKAFTKLSKELLSSETGKQLLALGYTTKDVNEGMLAYIEATGGRTKTELANNAVTKQITASSATYLENLDALARITGKSREAQQEELNAASKNAAWQAKLLTMTPAQRDKAILGLQNELAKGGKGAADAFQSKIMNVAPDKAGQLYTATFGEAASLTEKAAEMVFDKSKTELDMQKNFREGMIATRNGLDKFNKESLYYIIRTGGPLAETFQTMGVTANKVRDMDEKEIEQLMKTVAAKDSEARYITEANASIKEFTQALTAIVSPIVSLLTPAIRTLAAYMGEWSKNITEWFGGLGENAQLAVSGLSALAVALLVGGGLRGLFGGGGGARAGGAAGGAVSGIGQGVGGALSGIAGGLRAFASPAVLVGSINFGLAVAAIGAGIAAAAWLTGKALPTFAEGMLKLQELDGDALGNVAMGVLKIGGSLLPFSVSGLMLIPAAMGLNLLADGLLKLHQVSPDHLLKVAAAMEKVNAATPSIGQTLKSGFSNIIQNITGGGETKTEENIKTPTSAATDNSALIAEIRKLTTMTSDVLKNIRAVEENTRRNVDATRSLNGNLFSTV